MAIEFFRVCYLFKLKDGRQKQESEKQAAKHIFLHRFSNLSAEKLRRIECIIIGMYNPDIGGLGHRDVLGLSTAVRDPRFVSTLCSGMLCCCEELGLSEAMDRVRCYWVAGHALSLGSSDLG